MGIEILGICSGICTSSALIPQVVRIFKQKRAENISYWMIAITIAGLAGWIWYGSVKNDWAITITNTFGVLVNITMLIGTIKYKNADKQIA